MIIKKLFTEKNPKDFLTAAEWNELTDYVNEAVDAINEGVPSNNSSSGTGNNPVTAVVDPLDSDKTNISISNVKVAELTDKGDKGVNITLAGNNNINIEPREALGTGEGKNQASNANRKGGNIAFKPGDDIEFWAHHRGSSKNDEVSVKILTEVPKANDPTKTDEVAAKLQLNTADIVLTSKDKLEDINIMNIIINLAANTRGYLKVRALAIDLRCESHGGVALQPKGYDNDGHMNKIKFEHGGGDGLEFGTFNPEHTSLFTTDYRFNKNGIIRLATRITQASGKVPNDNSADNTPVGAVATNAYIYLKLDDDFYDVINNSDPTCTWEDIITFIDWAKTNNKGPWGQNEQL